MREHGLHVIWLDDYDDFIAYVQAWMRAREILKRYE